MGTCRSKEATMANTDKKEVYCLENNTNDDINICESVTNPHEGGNQVNSEEEIVFKHVSTTLKSSKEEINVSYIIY